jgi:hypothetical protein
VPGDADGLLVLTGDGRSRFFAPGNLG